jgi:uncharacterized protein YabN with tetrapyrrole methylase and pyrophosphatase domain
VEPLQADPPPDSLDRVIQLVRFLRANCPWDAAQTPRSLLPYLLEEAHEVADAVTAGDDVELRRELGDLLLNVAFQIVLAEERGGFGAAEVADAVEAKMRRRHPQLYGEGEAQPWEQLKAAERGEGSMLAGLARGLDPLSRAHRIQERVSGIGFDWPNAGGAFEKVAEELQEVAEALQRVAALTSSTPTPVLGAPGDEPEPAPASSAPRGSSVAAAEAELEAELGDLLFAVVNLTRLAGTHAMHALQRANQKFSDRFQRLELLARKRGVQLGKASLAELDALWDDAKREEREAREASA